LYLKWIRSYFVSLQIKLTNLINLNVFKYVLLNSPQTYHIPHVLKPHSRSTFCTENYPSKLKLKRCLYMLKLRFYCTYRKIVRQTKHHPSRRTDTNVCHSAAKLQRFKTDCQKKKDTSNVKQNKFILIF
jgi:hypothetical protein